MLFYSILFFAIFVISGRVPFSLKGLALAIVPVKEYWFTRVYIGLFIISPFLNVALNSLSKEFWRNLNIVLLILFSLTISATALSVGGSSIVWFVTLYSIAGYIRVHGLNGIVSKKPAVIYFVAMILLYLGVIVLDGYSSYILRYNFVLVLLGAVCLFMVFLKLPNASARATGIINKAAKCTFGIYLIHENSYVREFLWNDLLNTKLYANNSWGIAITVLIVIGVYIVCTLIDLIRERLFRPLLESNRYGKIDVWFNKVVSVVNQRFDRGIKKE